MTELHIKNMVCPRCVMAVETLLKQHNLDVLQVELGMAQVTETLTDAQQYSISQDLESLGFELLSDPQTQLVETIRATVIEWVRIEGDREKLSIFLQHRLAKEYSALSKIFSQVRGITIERYAILLRIELAKELLCYSQLDMAEIAYRLGYASPTHFSAQFRKETGLSPKAFRQLGNRQNIALRKGFDQV